VSAEALRKLPAMILQADEHRELVGAVRYQRRALERLLSAGYPNRTSLMDRQLEKRIAMLDGLVAKLEAR
jgi:hypothetical protein